MKETGSTSRGAIALGLGAGAGAALGLACAPDSFTPSLAVLGALTLPAAVVLSISEQPERRVLGLAFLGAVGVRALAALALDQLAPPDFFALDDSWYSRRGWELAQSWAGQGARPTSLSGAIGYYRWNALLFTLVGHVPLAPALANAALGGFAVLLAHAIAGDLAGPRAARSAALLTAFWPSLVLWSSLNLKDAAAILAILLLVRGAQRLQERVAPGALCALVGGLFLLAQLRGYLAWVAALAVLLAWTLPRLRLAPVPVAALLLVAALAAAGALPVHELQAERHLVALEEARSQLATGGSAYGGAADVSTAGGALRFLPVGLAYFLLAPAPWQLFNARQLLTLPEMLAWYALLPMVGLGLVASLRQRFASALPVASFALFASLSYALVEGNLGTAYRHRAQVLVLLLIFASVGLAWRRRVRVAPPAPSSLRDAAAPA